MFTFTLTWAWIAALTIGIIAWPRLTIVLVLVIVSIAMSGCATRSPEEVAWSQAMTMENWRLCEMVYEDAGHPTVHHGHTHRRGGRVHGMDALTAARLDLMHNQCRQVLGPYWAE